MNRSLLGFAGACTALLFACESVPEADGSERATRTPADDATSAASLSLGARGARVRDVYAYLAQYGYFPNATLAQRYPGFAPLVAEAPHDPAIYDERLARGVRAFQRLHGLPETGVADAPTLASMTPRDCSFPDGYAAAQTQDPNVLAFHINRTVPSLSWSIDSAPPGETVESLAALIREMAAVWETVHPGSFERVTGRRGNFGVGFRTIDGRSSDDDGDLTCDRQCVLGQAAGSSGITLDTNERWSFRGSLENPNGKGFDALNVDFQSVVLHEIGHVLGIQHSDRQGAVMFPRYTRGSIARRLSEDDKLAVRAGSSAWKEITTPAPVTDVHGAPLAIVTDEPASEGGGRAIYRADDAGFQRLAGGAVRISGDARGRLWIVRDDGQVRVQRSDDAGWIALSGCARDVGVGGTGGVWLIGCDGGLHKADVDPAADDAVIEGASKQALVPVPDDSPETLKFVSVAGLSATDAVVLDSEGHLHRLVDGTLRRVSLTDTRPMADIGAALRETIWAGARSGQGVYALDIQTEIKYPDNVRIAAAAQRKWQGYASRSVARVSVDAAGRPLVVDGSGKLFTTTK